MRAIFAVGDAWSAKKLLAGKPMLFSFAYVGSSWVPTTNLHELAAMASSVVFDSGAFTAWKRQTAGKSPLEIDLEKYAYFLMHEAPRWEWALSFDVIGNPQASIENWHQMRARCNGSEDKIVPVFHEGSPLEFLDHYVERAPRVAIGRTAGRDNVRKCREFYDLVFNRHPDACIHALGNSNPATIEPYPFDSFDSTSWQRSNQICYAESLGFPWNRTSRETRMRAFIEACETIDFRPVVDCQLSLFGPDQTAR